MNFQITPAPTKEIAIGIKIMDLAIVPHQTRSARFAITKPKNVLSVGTIKSHPKLFKILLLKSGSLIAQT